MKRLLGFSIFIGTAIGVGIFSLPYVAMKTGAGIFLLLIGGIFVALLWLHLIFTEICVNTKEKHFSPGYVGAYLGKGWGHFTFFINTSALTGALIAYLIIGSSFLNSLAGQWLVGGEELCVMLLFVVVAILVFLDIGSVSVTELVMAVLLVGVFAIFGIMGASRINFSNFLTVDAGNIFLPYGPIMFSMLGIPAIPHLNSMFTADRRGLKKIVVWGLTFVLIISILFSLLVLGISGADTTSDAISGLINKIPESLIKIIFLFGFLSIFTSYLTLSLSIKKSLLLDYKVNKHLAWGIAMFIPYYLYLIGFDNFIKIISIVGSVFIGLLGVLILKVYLKVIRKKKYKGYKLSKLTVYALMTILLLGALLELIFSLIKA